MTKPLNRSRVALLTSAAIRLVEQQPFSPQEDLTFRWIPSDPGAGEIVLDHHSRIGTVPRQDPEIVFPRAALANLKTMGTVAGVSPFHVSVKGGTRKHRELESDIGPAIARKFEEFGIDLALLVPY